jgi:hypothetical protein
MRKFAILVCIGLLLASAPVCAQGITDNFYITVGAGNVIAGGGSGFGDGEWYVYPSMWINQWFYDHPFDPARSKIIHVEFDWVAYDPACPVNLTVALNWSTPDWSALGYGDTEPPLPGVDEELYIHRGQMLYECGDFPQTQHFATDFIIYCYNPEWVSIDVRGCNFIITNGVLVHECVIGTEETSWGGIKASFK